MFIALSTLGIIVIVLGVLVILFFIGGLLGARARDRRGAGAYEGHVRAADAALEQARAGDRGWHRDAMETVAREAVDRARPGWAYDDLHLVLVDDRPGSQEDRAHFVALGSDGECRVVLARDGDRWVAESVDA